MVIASLVRILDFRVRHRSRNKFDRKSRVLFGDGQIYLLALLLLFCSMSSLRFCKGAILLDEKYFFRNMSSPSTPSPVVPNRESRQLDSSSDSSSILTMAAATIASGDVSDSLYVVRNNLGDTFFDMDQSWLSCSLEKCTRRSSGTATIALESNNIGDIRKLIFDRDSGSNERLCYCRCLPDTPVFREDLHLCVNEIHECPLVNFVSGSIYQKIPYVFLPLRGQIIYPNAEIKFLGVRSAPTCILSRVRYLGRSGWLDVKNYSIAEYNNELSSPFKLFHDKHRTFLQWLGNAELRLAMEGRLILIDLICKDTDSQLIFTPCIAFRVAGIPGSSNFLPDRLHDPGANFEKDKRFSSNEYIALGLATLLIALIYVASVFLYLRFKKNKLEETSTRRNKTFKPFADIEENVSHLFSDHAVNQSKQLVVEEEGLIKNNPLLLKRYQTPSSPVTKSFQPEDGSKRNALHADAANASSTDTVDVHSPVQGKGSHSLERSRKTTNLVHNGNSLENSDQRWSLFRNRLLVPYEGYDIDKEKMASQKQTTVDANNIEEKHPDENISIVECSEDVVQTSSKHKLYFNPAYLEPELLMAPPPAAIEFLMKIREIMTLAKRKISTKKFLPSLTEIPEEIQSGEELSEKRSTVSRRKCEKSDPIGSARENVTNVEYRNEDKDKRQIIQKWLQSIPTSQSNDSSVQANQKISTENNVQKDPTIREFSDNEGSLSDKLQARDLESLHSNHTARQKTPKRSLERRKQNMTTPATAEALYSSNGTVSNSTFNSNLPLDEELTMQNTIYNVVTGNTTLSKLKIRYEDVNQAEARLSEEHVEGRYSLVSEVYVNDGFSSSGGSSLSSSLNSLVAPMAEADKASPTHKYEESSRLMIELNDCPFFYSVENMDDFEPDTLDRKPYRDDIEQTYSSSKFIDSLERPAICLRTRGSFRNESTFTCRANNLKRSFGSLQEIYQQRRNVEWTPGRPTPDASNAPQSLTPQIEDLLWRKDKHQQPRHYYRQRKLSPPPPLPCDISSFRRTKPPLPPRSHDTRTNFNVLKEQNCRTTLSKEQKVCFKNNIWSYKPDDSGYLSSSDSERSQRFARSCDTINDSIRVAEATINLREIEDDEDDDEDEDESICSFNDANSESGAESTATNFKFYKNRGRITAEG